jgi:hypothetical protein
MPSKSHNNTQVEYDLQFTFWTYDYAYEVYQVTGWLDDQGTLFYFIPYPEQISWNNLFFTKAEATLAAAKDLSQQIKLQAEHIARRRNKLRQLCL